MEEIEELKKMKAQDKEHKCWLSICDKLMKITNQTREQFNENPEMRDLVIRIEEWAYYNYLRRLILKDNKAIGVFWSVGNSYLPTRREK
jgi:hypothetical protein